MDIAPEKIVVVEPDPPPAREMQPALQAAGYELQSSATSREGLDAIQQTGARLLLTGFEIRKSERARNDGDDSGRGHDRGDARCAFGGRRSGGAGRRAWIWARTTQSRGLANRRNYWRVCARACACKRVENQLRDKMRIAEEGQQIAHTAFEALAVTEKMASNALSLDRKLKTGFGGGFGDCDSDGGIYFLFARSAQKVTQRSNSFLTKLEGGILRQQDLIAQARKLRAQQESTDATLPGKDELQKTGRRPESRKWPRRVRTTRPPAKATGRDQRAVAAAGAEGARRKPSSRLTCKSVCLLHVAVAFSDQQTGRRLRYGGLESGWRSDAGQRRKSDFNLDGNGPEVKMDVFGTGFLAGPDGRVITNRHVAEPWWKNDEIAAMTKQGLQPQISVIRAYFPGDPRAFHAEIQEISQETDLAAMRVDMQDLKRSVLSIETAKGAAMSGQPMILMGYATGLAAILARTDEETAQTILKKSGSDVSQVLDELAKRNLIRPLITQGHIGDILPDKIVFDAQTTSGRFGRSTF